MAPKIQPAARSLAKGTKRSAAVLKKRPAAAAAAHGTVRSRKITAGQCRSIVAALEGAEELPKHVRDMLATLVGQSLSESQHPYQEAAMAVVGDALTDIEMRLSSELEEAKAAQVEEADKSAREDALHQAVTYMSEQKQSIDQSKVAAKEAAQAMKTAQEELHAAQAAQRMIKSEQKKLETKILQLQNVEKDTYQPLKDSPASGQQGQKMVKTLRKVGKDFGFHDVLMDVLPVVLKKQPDRRRTFDGITMQQLEAEFCKHSSALQDALKVREAVIGESSEAVQAAQTAVTGAKNQFDSATTALTEAEENLLTGKNALVHARQQVRTFDSEMRKTARDLANKAARLQSFQQGPLAAFRELSKRGPAVKVEADVASMAASDEDADRPAVKVEADAASMAASDEEALTQTLRQP